ncbi:hypothetical protein N9980_00860 [bacterium]|nr:hypothetical protein [bacterium]
MAKGDWLYKTMKLIGPKMVASRQLTRAMRRNNAKRKLNLAKQEAARTFKQGGSASVRRLQDT